MKYEEKKKRKKEEKKEEDLSCFGLVFAACSVLGILLK